MNKTVALVNSCLKNTQAHADVFAPSYNEQRTEIQKDLPLMERRLEDRASGVLPDATYAIGGTPMIALDRLRALYDIKCRFYAKAECYSAGGSVKDRLARRMLELIEAEGEIKKGDMVVEATSGNTGIGLAMMCAVRGYQAVIVMPEKMSAEKANTLKALGAIVVRTRTSAAFDDEDSHIVTAYRFVAEVNSRSENTGVRAFIPDQYKHQGNVLAHYQETGAEILAQTGMKVDRVVISAGTGGTITGVAQRVKEALPSCVITGVDPKGSILHRQRGSWTNADLLPYEVEGIGYDFYPPVFHQSLIDEWEVVDDAESFAAARELIKHEGILAGGSSGTALAAAIRKARSMKPEETCVVILPDNIRNYLTKFAADDWMTLHSFAPLSEHPLHLFYEGNEQTQRLSKVTGKQTLDASSVSLGALPTLTTQTTVKEAYEILSRDKSSHALVRQADTGLLLAVLAKEDLDDSILWARSATKPIAEVIHPTFLQVLSGAASLADFATLIMSADKANRSKNPAIVMIDTPLTSTDLKATRSKLQNMTEVDQRSGIARLVTKDMITAAVLSNSS